jgi:uncharacterized repeat protein (TIGR02543 family)
MSISAVVLHVIWVPLYSVVYDGNGAAEGDVPVDLNGVYPEGSNVVVLGQGSLFINNRTFIGWYLPATSQVYLENETFTITEDTTLYAVWIIGNPPLAEQLFVVYVGNGYTSGTAPIDSNAPYHFNDQVTVLNQGSLTRAGYVFLGWNTDPKAKMPKYVPGNKFNIQNKIFMLYAVWTNNDDGGNSGGSNIIDVDASINVPFDGYYAGTMGSKGTTLGYVGLGNEAVLKVASNFSDLSKSAVIENLIIDGKNKPDMVGILLEDVSNCLIRNVTIMNCAVGIKVKLTGGKGAYAQGKRFEHVRMINVNVGILFEGVNIANDFSYTFIDDVGISLANGSSSNVGVKIGACANLFSVFIKANIWLNESNGTGLEMENSLLKYSLVNFAVEEIVQNTTGKGIVLNAGANISENQHFLLSALGLSVLNRIKTNGGSTYSDISIAS